MSQSPSILRCPCSAKAALVLSDARLLCTREDCGRSYPLIGGIPILINDANSVFAVSDYLGGSGYPGTSYTNVDTVEGSAVRRLYRRFAVWLTEFSVPLRAVTEEDAIDVMLDGRASEESGNAAHVLAVGCGRATYRERPGCLITYTDVALGPRVAYICDAHDLPFADGVFDLVIASAVMEHVAEPQRCVSEILRVLRPDGWVYAVTPFLQPVHMGAYDFTRFTLLGHRRLFRYFDEIDSGMALGPAASVAFCTQYLLTGFFTQPLLRKVARLVGLLITSPLKYLDVPLRHKNGALDAAAATYFLGRRRETPISDRDLVREYRGLN